MSLPKYSSYKEIEIGWLDRIPAHWQQRPLFAVAKEQGRSNAGMTEDNLLSLSYGQIIQKNIMSNDGLLPASFETYQIVEPDEIVWRLTDLQNDQRSLRTAIATQRGIITSAYLVTKTTGLLPKYFSYLLRTYDVAKVFYSMGGGLRQSMKYSDVKWLPILVPSDAEQSAIVKFLDHELARLDKLMSEQEWLTELLSEKRRAIITRAVTGAKSSENLADRQGAPWTEIVPKHWSVGPLKRLFRSIDYGISETLDTEGKVAILRMGNIANGRIVTQDLKYVESVDPSLLLEKNDLLYNRTNSLDLIGKVGMFVGNGDAPTSFASYLVRLRTVESVMPEYLAYLLNTEAVLGQARANAFVAIGQCNLNPSRYGQINVAMPPFQEQASIVEYLNSETRKIDHTLGEVHKGLELLKDRRTALIFASVTGQIDVRSSFDACAA